MSALVDGQAWTAVGALAVNSSGIVAIAGGEVSGAIISFAFLGSAPGSYTIGPNEPSNVGTYTTGFDNWQANPFLGSGTIVVTSLTADRIAGTFAFVGVSVAGATPMTRSITNGVFDVALNSQLP